jgi:hypothetical protein
MKCWNCQSEDIWIQRQTDNGRDTFQPECWSCGTVGSIAMTHRSCRDWIDYRGAIRAIQDEHYHKALSDILGLVPVGLRAEAIALLHDAQDRGLP